MWRIPLHHWRKKNHPSQTNLLSCCTRPNKWKYLHSEKSDRNFSVTRESTKDWTLIYGKLLYKLSSESKQMTSETVSFATTVFQFTPTSELIFKGNNSSHRCVVSFSSLVLHWKDSEYLNGKSKALCHHSCFTGRHVNKTKYAWAKNIKTNICMFSFLCENGVARLKHQSKKALIWT